MPRHPPLRATPLLFAHRGGRAHAPENTLEAFRRAVELGATGLESDVWLTADGVPVLDHDGSFGRGLRRRGISRLARQDLPPHVPSLEGLYDALPEVADGTVHVALDVKDHAAAVPLLERIADRGRTGELWLASPDIEALADWRHLDDAVRLVDSTRLERIREGPERRAATLAEAGIDAINLPESDWSGGLCALFHRFGLECLGWDAQQVRQAAALLDIGVDGVFGDHVDRLVAAARGG